MAPSRQRPPSPHPTDSLATDPLAGPSTAHLNHHGIADLFPYQEIFLRILSFLSPADLTMVQRVNKYGSRMSMDPQLWKRLYLARYPHPHHSRLIYTNTPSSGTNTPPRSLRPIARLPSRAFPPPSPSRSPSASSIGPSTSPLSVKDCGTSRKQGIGHAVPLSKRDDVLDEVGYGVRNDGVDWKMMLRLGTNWSNGNALSQTTISLPPSPAPTKASPHADPPFLNRSPPYSEQYIALSPSFIFTSNPASPLVHVHGSSASPSSTSPTPLGIIPPPPGWSSPSRPDNVTAICADQSVPLVDQDDGIAEHRQLLPTRLAVFYQSGGFVILRIRLDSQSRIHWSRDSIHPAQSRPRSLRRATAYSLLEGDPIVLATFHYPVLLTCTVGFHLSVYSLSEPVIEGIPARPLHLSTMHSDVSFHPAALSLFPTSDGNTSPDPNPSINKPSYHVALTYCTPLYPSSWTVAVQEFTVNLDMVHSSGSVWRGDCYHVSRGDDAEDDIDIWPRKIRPVVGVRGRRAVGVGTDGRWCVLAGEDNQIQVYSLPTPSPSPPPTKLPSITHSQTLLAHSSAVTSISLSAGRCVSGGRDGRVLVWELDEDEAVEEDGKVGRTVGYVEVRPGGRRQQRQFWKGPSGPDHDNDDDGSNEGEGKDSGPWLGLPHPASISSAARSLFLPRPPDVRIDDRPPVIRQLAFDEEKIVGLVRVNPGGDVSGKGEIGKSAAGDGRRGVGMAGEIMKVWSFNG